MFKDVYSYLQNQISWNFQVQMDVRGAEVDKRIHGSKRWN